MFQKAAKLKRPKHATPGSDLRPLEGKAVKSISDTLRPHIADVEMLDLFSGTGRLGIALLKEGVRSVHFVENDAATLRQLRKSTDDLDQVTILGGDVFDRLRLFVQGKKQFGLVFADPPYRIWDQEFSNRLAQLVEEVLCEEGIFLVRSPKRVVTSPPTSGYQTWKLAEVGESNLWYLIKEPQPSET